MGIVCRELIESNFNLADQAVAYKELYEDLFAGQAARTSELETFATQSIDKPEILTSMPADFFTIYRLASVETISALKSMNNKFGIVSFFDRLEWLLRKIFRKLHR